MKNTNNLTMYSSNIEINQNDKIKTIFRDGINAYAEACIDNDQTLDEAVNEYLNLELDELKEEGFNLDEDLIIELKSVIKWTMTPIYDLKKV